MFLIMAEEKEKGQKVAILRELSYSLSNKMYGINHKKLWGLLPNKNYGSGNKIKKRK